jgi:hypothetical protein
MTTFAATFLSHVFNSFLLLLASIGALRDVQCERPVFAGGAEGWWKDVIRKTAVGAGAHAQGENNYGPIACPLGDSAHTGQR